MYGGKCQLHHYNCGVRLRDNGGTFSILNSVSIKVMRGHLNRGGGEAVCGTLDIKFDLKKQFEAKYKIFGAFRTQKRLISG